MPLRRVLHRFDYTIDFLSIRREAFLTSTAILFAGIIALGLFGLNFGIDFTGGTLVEVGYEQPADLERIREKLDASGFDEAIIQHFGTDRDVMIRLGIHTELVNQAGEAIDQAEFSSRVLQALQVDGDVVEMRRVEFVGPQIGAELIEQGGLAVLLTLAGILVYVSARFQWRFALGAIAALAHDTLFVLSMFAFFRMEFDLTVLAAILAVIGYSLNDTIVVFDRVRDNFLKMRKRTAEEVVNASINQILGRTLMTSVTTLIVLIVLFYFGGELIHNFASALILGVVVGTYSSIYIASASALHLGLDRQSLLPPQKEGADLPAQMD